MATGATVVLQLILSAIPDARYAPTHVPLAIVFRNAGGESLTLLRRFTPLPVFFAVNLTREDGTPLDLPGAGKIAFAEDDLEYLRLDPRERFGFEVDIAPLAPSPATLSPGRYRVSVTYHNQYGDDCFQGSVTSNTIDLVIGAR